MSVIATVEDLLACSGKVVAIDIETTSLRWWSGEMIGIGFWTPESSGYIPTLTEFERWRVEATVEDIIANPKTTIIAHNLTFESLFLGFKVRGAPCRFIDTMVCAHLEDSRQRKGLEAVAEKYLGLPKVKHIYKVKGRNASIHQWPLDLVSEYCVNDCEVEYKLAQALMPKLKEQGLAKLFWKDMAYLGLLIEISRRGMLVNLEFINRAEKLIANNVVLMEHELHEKTGQDFNWRSPMQLSKALYEGMGIDKPVNPFLGEDGIDRNFGKSPLYKRYNESSTSSFLLMEKAKHPLGNLVLDLRESDKLCKNYLRDWKDLADEDGVVHGSLNITGTITGRLSSSNPNLQNMPGEVRTRETQSIYSGGALRADEYNLRQAFIARPGYKFLSIDFRQQEGRLLAILARDEQMIEFVKAKKDIHSEVARMVWGEATKVYREWSKTITFGLCYGMSTGSLQHRLNKTPAEAAAITSAYWEKFPRIMPYLDESLRLCRRQGYVRNWSGRIWREEDQRYQYRATNFLVQGGGADLLSVAAMRCQDWLDANDAGHLVSLIHDEQLFEVKEEAFDEAFRKLSEITEVGNIFNVPFLTEAKAGRSYGELEEIK